MTQSFLERYDAGNRAEVWAELRSITALSEEPRSIREAAIQVCSRAMERAASNVTAIHGHLLRLGFQFEVPKESYSPPTVESAELNRALISAVGPVPLTLQAWLGKVGSVIFRGQRTTSQPGPLDQLLDPLEFTFSHDMVSDGLEQQSERIEDGDIDARFRFEFAGDLYHKNEISGGGASFIELPADSVDALVIEDDAARIIERKRLEGLPLGQQDALALHGNSDRQIWFIDYLREYFEGGGFRRLGSNDDLSFQELTGLANKLLEI
jgi:hypothetical protein